MNKSKTTIVYAVVVALLAGTALSAVAQEENETDYFAVGKSWANARGNGPAPTDQLVGETLPEAGKGVGGVSGTYGNGSTVATGAGTQRQAECATKNDPECAAMTFFYEDDTASVDDVNPPQALIDKSNAIEDQVSGAQSPGQMGFDQAAPKTECVEIEVSSPGQTYEESCTVYLGGEQHAPEAPLVVEVEERPAYSCEFGQTEVKESCQGRELVVVVENDADGNPQIVNEYWQEAPACEYASL